MFVEAKYFIHFMERQKKVMMAAEGGDRLSNLPESILLYILSLLPNSKQVVQTSVLSSQWRFLWKSVPVSIEFDFSDDPKAYREKHILAYVASVNRELHYWRFCEKIKSFSVFIHSYVNIDRDIDFWVYFATNIGKVEEFWLKFYVITYPDLAYKFPEFGYTNTVLRKLALGYCQVKPYGNVNWSNLISLSIGDIDITEDVMEKVLLGSPNLECLELDNVVSIRRLEISSVNLRKMILKHDSDDCHCLEIHAPYIRHLELWGLCCKEKHFQLRDVGSLVTAVLSINVYIPKKAEKECKYLRELLHHVAHVENLELSPCCIECLSILELKGLPIPPSNWKFLKLNAALEKLDYPGICNFLSSSSNLETLIIDWFNRKPRKLLSKCTNEDERWRKLWTRYFNCSLPHLKTIKFINCCEKPMENNVVQPLVKWLQKNATALKEFVISSRRNRGK